ncbi:hypothetical protein I656_03388 [Geobacillus sp. WSUCF1]|uniref:Uncharacterized protein n=1 Tax=Geobacillus thermopakistaniensis (strain MAS1) TaxID=1408282 RepID=A0A7U9P5N1_GEOTM|nr:hypothetical protein I656_03388 [Geobacillus sp. WSUCF1]EQB95198.1 hypothetical protein GA8_12715 [Geobacillus sp. A8]ESU71668.1 hypothetical protein T260_12330 [Geobacillus sp. MAS1]
MNILAGKNGRYAPKADKRQSFFLFLFLTYKVKKRKRRKPA